MGQVSPGRQHCTMVWPGLWANSHEFRAWLCPLRSSGVLAGFPPMKGLQD